MVFPVGIKVEVCSEQEGYEGSYYSAKILNRAPDIYMVQYDTLVRDDESGPLVEVVQTYEVRPTPPEINVPVGGFVLNQEVDAFDRDGWWVGKVCGLCDGDSYPVYFDVPDVVHCYGVDQLRVHQDWVEDIWVIPTIFNDEL